MTDCGGGQLETILGIILGAILGGVGKIVFEAYKRRQDRKTVAAAIAGEISATIRNANLKQLPAYFQDLSANLKSAAPRLPPWAIYDTSVKEAPVAEAYMARLGELGPDLARRVTEWYSTMAAIRLEVKILAAGARNHDPHGAAAMIDGALALWDAAEPAGNQLMEDLIALSR